MKTVGLIGGMSWESTESYYRVLNQTVKAHLGGLHSAKVVLYSVDFAEIEEYQARGAWDKSAAVLCDAARALERAGADFLVICTNTMHKVAPQIADAVSIPLLHIADATADALLRDGITRVALLGTNYTMTQDFYKERLRAKGLDVCIPDAPDRETVHRIIYDELCLGICDPASRAAYQAIIDRLKAAGAQAVILGCTEIGLLIAPEHSSLPVYDTAAIHATRAALALLD